MDQDAWEEIILFGGTPETNSSEEDQTMLSISVRTTADIFVGEFTSRVVPRVGDAIRCVFGDSVQPRYLVREVEHVFRHIPNAVPPPRFASIYFKVTVEDVGLAPQGA